MISQWTIENAMTLIGQAWGVGMLYYFTIWGVEAMVRVFRIAADG